MTDTLSVVIPYVYGGHERERIHLWNMVRLSKILPGVEIIIGEDYSDPFNRSIARNNGARGIRSDFTAFIDSDTVFNPMLIHRGIQAIKDGAPWCIPFERYVRTDSYSAEKMLEAPADAPLSYLDYSYDYVFTHPPTKYESPESGCILFRSQDVAKFGGYNEDFNGWGFEDRAVVYAADCVLGQHRRTEGTVWHIWHPEAPSDLAKNKEFYKANERLATKMKKITDPDEMKRINGPL